ncbi:MAG: metallophosphoesterase family protein [Sphingobium sp.]|nr:metallophosphoesterase family protein [Sphingobium sp.]
MTRIAILSDIHGNLPALEAVLADVAARGVTMTVNLGDILSGPLFPGETADRLIPLALSTIRGNHERQLLTLGRDQMGPSDRHAADRLSPAHWAWIAALPETLTPCADVHMVHGAPGSDLLYFLDSVTPAGIRHATPDEIATRAGDVQAGLILCGHTHLAGEARLADGRLVVNPGSVGLPAYADDQPWPHVMETGSPHARYAIATRAQGRWSVEQVAVDYDWESAARRAEANQRPDWARALRTGFA